jgi:hypothetical protein
MLDRLVIILKNEIRLLKRYIDALGQLSIKNDYIKTITSNEYKMLIDKLNEKDKELEEFKKQYSC